MEDEKLIFEVTDSTFDELVIEGSSETPVAVDFWAEWCAPCKALSPILEKVVRSLGGAIRLGKLDIGSNPSSGARFGIRGVPTVKVFRAGQVAIEFVGVLPEEEVRRVFDKVIPQREDTLVEEALKRLSAGDAKGAEEKLEQVLQTEPSHARANLEMGRLALSLGELERGKRHLEAVPEGTGEFEEAARYMAMVEFKEACDKCGGLGQAQQKLERAPSSNDAKFDLARCLAADMDYEGALELLLQIVQANREYRDGAAKEAMVRIFAIAGQQSLVAQRYRSRLASALY